MRICILQYQIALTHSMNRIFFSMAFAMWSFYCHAQLPVALNSSPQGIAVAGCDVAQNHYFSGMGNPAGLAFGECSTAALYYERRYNLAQLSTKGMAGSWSSQWGTWGVNLAQFGFSSFQATRYAVSYSRAFADKVAAGLQLNLRDDYQAGTEHVAALFSSVGIQYQATRELTVGAHCYNPEQAVLRYPGYDVALPTYFELGLNWNLLSHTAVMAEAEQSLGCPVNLAVGMESTYKGVLVLRGGYRLTDNHFSWGLGARLKKLAVDMGFSYQMPLGLVSSMALSWTFKQKAK